MRPTQQFKPFTRFISAIFFVFAAFVPLMGLGQFTSGVLNTTATSGNWTVPCGVTSITVEVWGGGGAGAGDQTTTGGGSGGGASGGYVSQVISVQPGATISYSVGAAVAGTTGTLGATGNPTSFGIVTAPGGNGGNGINGGAAVTGGNPGSNGTLATGGNGGATPILGGNNGLQSPGNAGGNGTAPGGGGAGGDKDGGGDKKGGDGASGGIRLTWVVGSLPTVNAGVAQTICSGTSATLAGSFGGSATGATWSAPSGSFGNTTVMNTTYTPSITSGTVTLTLTNNTASGTGTCAVTSTVVITVNQAATTNANVDQSLCSGGSITLAGSIGGSATSSTWSAPSGTFSNATSLTSTYTPSITSGTVTLTLTTNDPAGVCPAATDQMVVTVSSPPSTATINGSTTPAAVNLTCPTTTTTLTGNTPAVGTGTWSVTSGSGTVSPTNSPSTTATAGTGATVYTWTISNPGCPSSSASITVNLPVCNDDPCGAYPLTVVSSTNCTPTVNLTNVGSTFSTGMPDPACGYVNGTTSGDVWYSAVVPADGQLQITAVGDVNFDPMVSVYDGACASLQAAGCVASNGYASNAFPLTYAGTPGSTIYIRVNESLGGDATTGSFGLCAYTTNTGTVSQVLPGVTTTVSCGSTLNFYDPGGQGGTATTSTLQPPPAGNYTNNTGTTYRICPSDPTQYVQIQFNQFYVENGFDKMIITSGNNNVIAQWTSNQGAGDIVTSQAPGECLTIYFQSDYIYTGLGWEAVVSCTNTMQPSQINNESSVQNCTGNGGVWVCADGTYNTAAGSGAGIDEINEVTGGCWGAAGEVATSWFYFTTASAGSLAFEFVPSNSGHNINFALYGPSTNGVPPCPLITGDAPIRCSFADVGGANTGLQAGQTDSYDGNAGYGGNGFAEPVTVVAGQTYALAVDVYQNGQPPTQTTIDFTGVAALSCNFPLPITLSDFSGINQGNENLLSWIVQSQYNNDYFTVERSLNGINWQVVGRVEGEGTSDRPMFYDLRDPSPYFPITYYRLKQTDFDGEYNYSHIISISSLKDLDGEFIGHLSPNPASGYATFNYNGTDVTTPLNVQIVNEMGKVINNLTFMNIFKGMPQTIGTSELANGTYQIIFTQGDKRQVQKLVILR